jgi:hypothetical protein
LCRKKKCSNVLHASQFLASEAQHILITTRPTSPFFRHVIYKSSDKHKLAATIKLSFGFVVIVYWLHCWHCKHWILIQIYFNITYRIEIFLFYSLASNYFVLVWLMADTKCPNRLHHIAAKTFSRQNKRVGERKTWHTFRIWVLNQKPVRRPRCVWRRYGFLQPEIRDREFDFRYRHRCMISSVLCFCVRYHLQSPTTQMCQCITKVSGFQNEFCMQTGHKAQSMEGEE